MSSLPMCKVYQIGAESNETSWMIEGLWLNDGVGLLGGEPKSFKTFAALSLAVAVSSGKPCFGHYPVRRQGAVMLYAAEDSLVVVRQRIEGIAEQMGADFGNLDIHVITSPKLRIDSDIDRKQMEDAIRLINPVLLILLLGYTISTKTHRVR